MANVTDYKKINRFWGSSSVSTAREIDESTGKSQKDFICDKLNTLLETDHDAGVEVIKGLIQFKQARRDSWFGTGKAAQSAHLSTIDAILNQLSLPHEERNNYPTLEELMVLVKNSSHLFQKA